jgi:glycosyltransferase involved in cell wall biosynthesis
MKFTIGIPAFKTTFLKECIDSILGQTFFDFEIVIVNDASPENIDGIVGAYNEPVIRYYKNETNFGAINVVDNWNKCLSYARGTYFILMGDDDKMCPDYLEEFSNLIEEFPNCGVYHCRSLIINEKSTPLRLTDPRPEYEGVYDAILQRIKGYRTFFISDYVFRTETLRINGGFYKLPLGWASDDISSYIAAEKHGIAHTNKPIFMYRQNAQTISSTGNVDLKMEAVNIEKEWLNDFLKKPAPSPIDELVKGCISAELEKFVKKKRIDTLVYSSNASGLNFFITNLRKMNRYNLSLDELLYAVLMKLKEKRKKRYESA